MNPKRLTDTERFLRHLAAKHNLVLSERAGKGSHRSYAFRAKSGRKVATLVLKVGDKEVSRGVLRNIGTALREQASRTGDNEVRSAIQDLIRDYERWVRS